MEEQKRILDRKEFFINKWIKLTREIFLKNLDKEKYYIFIFGSRARKVFSHSSDLDIGILGSEPIEEKLINKIKEEIEESIVPFHIDIVDFSKVDENFKSIALKDIIVWNKPRHISINY